jgi:predicted nucleotidyltransferase component of viral defense system
MKSREAPDLSAIIRTFETIPELKSAGVLAGATALHHEYLENRLGRFSFDIDLQNQVEEIESVHHRFSPRSRQILKLIGRLSDDFYQYQARVGKKVVRVEVARPYLRHRKKYEPSRHVQGLMVVSLSDLLFAKVSAYSTRGLPRDLIDLFAVSEQKQIHWEKLLWQAARSLDNDYNPVEFHAKLQLHKGQCLGREFWQELPVTHRPNKSHVLEFVKRLREANRVVAQGSLQ